MFNISDHTKYVNTHERTSILPKILFTNHHLFMMLFQVFVIGQSQIHCCRVTQHTISRPKYIYVYFLILLILPIILMF